MGASRLTLGAETDTEQRRALATTGRAAAGPVRRAPPVLAARAGVPAAATTCTRWPTSGSSTTDRAGGALATARVSGATERNQREVELRQGSERDEPLRTGERRKEEPVDPVSHRSSDKLGEGPDALGLGRVREPANAIQLIERPIQTVEDGQPARPTPCH